MNILDKIKKLPFSHTEYIKEVTPKTQIVLHHTAGGDDIPGLANWWGKDKKRIAAHIIISQDGTPYQLFNSKYWAYHLGIKPWMYEKYGISPSNLNKTSIAIELSSWGGLKKTSDRFLTWAGTSFPLASNAVDRFSYKEYEYFNRYTHAQIFTLRELLLYFGDKYDIPLDYNESMWEVSKEALSRKPGIWSHTSFREDKSDCYPNTNLVTMLKNLK